MIIFKLKELIEKKEKKEKRKITMTEVSLQTGVNRTSLSKMLKPDLQHSTTTHSIEALCRYFKCRVQDLMVYVRDED